MGQVCFTAISSNRACPRVFIALSSVFQIIVLCACCPSVQWLGLRAKVPSSLRVGGSMVGSDRLNVPAIDNSSH